MAETQPFSVEIGQIVEERPHSGPTPDQHAGGHGDILARVQALEVMRGELDGIERAPHVVAQDSQQQISSSFLLRAEERDRFADGLIDGLVEADHVLEIRRARIAGVDPQAQHGGAQRAVLGRQLVDVEAASRAQQGMGLGRRLASFDRRGARPCPFKSCASLVCGAEMSLQTASRICSAWSRSSVKLMARALGSSLANSCQPKRIASRWSGMKSASRIS